MEEANVVEKILGHHIRKTSEAESHLGETIEEFLSNTKTSMYLYLCIIIT